MYPAWSLRNAIAETKTDRPAMVGRLHHHLPPAGAPSLPFHIPHFDTLLRLMMMMMMMMTMMG